MLCAMVLQSTSKGLVDTMINIPERAPIDRTISGISRGVTIRDNVERHNVIELHYSFEVAKAEK